MFGRQIANTLKLYFCDIALFLAQVSRAQLSAFDGKFWFETMCKWLQPQVFPGRMQGKKKHKISRKSIGGKKMAENLAIPKGNCWMFFLVKGRWFISNKQWYGKAELCTFMLPENCCCLFFGFPHYIAISAFCCQFLVNWIIPRDLYTHELLVFKSGAEVLHQFRSFDQFSLPSL